MGISIITYADILEGIYYGQDPSRYEEIFRSFLRGVAVLGVTRRIAERYARVSGELRAQGLLIPPPDLLIAATALEHRLTVVTRNRRHSARIPHLHLN